MKPVCARNAFEPSKDRADKKIFVSKKKLSIHRKVKVSIILTMSPFPFTAMVPLFVMAKPLGLSMFSMS